MYFGLKVRSHEATAVAETHSMQPHFGCIECDAVTTVASFERNLEKENMLTINLYAFVIVFNFNDYKYGFVHRKTILRRFSFIKFISLTSIFRVIDNSLMGNDSSANLRFVSKNIISDNYNWLIVSKTL